MKCKRQDSIARKKPMTMKCRRQDSIPGDAKEKTYEACSCMTHADFAHSFSYRPATDEVPWRAVLVQIYGNGNGNP